jgi:hypothetical protein
MSIDYLATHPTEHRAREADAAPTASSINPVPAESPGTTVTVEHARTLTDRFRAATQSLTDAVTELREVVPQIYATQAWRTLGYDTWRSYCQAEVGARLVRIDPAERRDLTRSLAEDGGMSSRAIGAALGVDEGTIRNDRRADSEPSVSATAENSALHSAGDGEAAPAEATETAAETDIATGHTVPAAPHDEGDSTDAADPTGASPGHWPQIDTDDEPGSEHTSPEDAHQEAPTARRKPITEAIFEAATEYREAAEKLARLSRDDRFRANRDRIAQLAHRELGAADTALRAVFAALDEDGDRPRHAPPEESTNTISNNYQGAQA